MLENLQPSDVFKYFEIISQIPRGSGNEKALSDYMMQFAKKLHLEAYQDEANNVYIKKPASLGYEHLPTVILQGHLDMVCEKNKESNHDFIKDGLNLYIEGDYIKAKGTSLGGDDGIAIAYQMAILANPHLKHPALECLMTTDEERGMTGVAHLHPEYLQGKILINIDNEKEGEFIVSCAGGAKAYSKLHFKKEAIINDALIYNIVIKGLNGGHSGVEIHHERANAHLLMGRLLNAFREQINFQLIKIEGGTKDNVITRECDVSIAINPEDKQTMEEIVLALNETFLSEYKIQDPNIQIEIKFVDDSQITYAIDNQSTNHLIDYLLLIPNGILAYDKNINGLVETSLNLGVLQIKEQAIYLASAIRSSVVSRKIELLTKLKVLANTFNMDFEIKGDYPAWQYQQNSRIRELAVTLYQKIYHKEPIVTAIHAGLECGYISEKCSGLDMISIGPDIELIHSPEEKLSISSAARVYAYLLQLLENIALY